VAQTILKLTGFLAVMSFLAIACGGGAAPPTQAPAPASQNTPAPDASFGQPGGPIPPHAFAGTVTIDGAPAAEGTQVTAFLEGVPDSVAGATVKDGLYNIKIVQRSSTLFADRKVTFKVGGKDSTTTAVWSSGEATELNLVVGAAAPAAVDAPPPSDAPAGALAIATDGDGLKFDQANLEAKAGDTVTVVFKNTSTINQHNWVLVQNGTKDAVSSDGTAAGPGAAWIPQGDDRVLAKSGLLDPGATEEINFTVPAAGTYQFVCTFPGHNFTMFGDFVATP
jgi:azurin